MNWNLLLLSLLQSFLLACGNVSLKLAMLKVPSFRWEWGVLKLYLLDYWFIFTGLFFGAATILWMYILKNFPFSASYPLTSFAYVFGLIAAMIVFHEPVHFDKWIGVALVIAGAFLLTRK